MSIVCSFTILPTTHPFHVGQEVVYIGNSKLLEKNKVYVVSELTWGSTLHGIHIAGMPCENKYGWASFLFRPVQKKSTDISVFTALLKVTKVPELV
jgi:hypothetical protein